MPTLHHITPVRVPGRMLAHALPISGLLQPGATTHFKAPLRMS